jgi:hypothetical protein
MSLPRYLKYKDSGVEWLGEVLERWNLANFLVGRQGSRTGRARQGDRQFREPEHA